MQKCSGISFIKAKYANVAVQANNESSLLSNFHSIFDKKEDSPLLILKKTTSNFVVKQTAKNEKIKKYPQIFKRKTHLDVWKLYRYGVNGNGEARSIALAAREELLENRYKDLIRKIAWKSFNHYKNNEKYSGTEEFADFNTYAVLGACHAFDRFDENQSTSLITFLQSTIQYHILQEVNSTLTIRCPNQKRGMRTYLSGGYDHNPDKKLEFELKHNIFSEDDVARAYSMHKTLVDKPIRFDQSAEYSLKAQLDEEELSEVEKLADSNSPTQNEINARLDRDMVLDSFTHEQQLVYTLYFINDENITSVAREANLTYKDVKIEIANIMKKMENLLTIV